MHGDTWENRLGGRRPELLGIKPIAQEGFRLADGSKIVRKKGSALSRYGKRVGAADVIFGEEGDSQVLLQWRQTWRS